MTPGVMANGFWNQANFRVADAVNSERWTRSPQLQLEIQPPSTLVAPGSVGPQQAMLEPESALGIDQNTVLPWVPDLVGSEANGDQAILIFGAAYAGFIREYSCRGACLSLADYVKAAKESNGLGWVAFQRQFLKNVVTPDSAYYGRLASLLTSVGVPARRIVLADLCSNSIVKRTMTNNRRRDDSRQPCRDRAPAFCNYVAHPVVAGWTWRRIIGSGARRIIALGHIAEHGLLKLFKANGASITCDGQPWSQLDQPTNTAAWVDQYADPSKKLGYWLTPGRWWTILLPETAFRLLPVYHPSTADRYDPGYAHTEHSIAGLLRDGY